MKNKIQIKIHGPLGPSELGKRFGANWNNESWGTDGPITCEICGTNHPERKEQSYIISTFLGHQVVEECCGAILDAVYCESGHVFIDAFLEEFSENPTAPRFLILLDVINTALIEASRRISETGMQVSGALKKSSNLAGRKE